jgi:iron complex transport system substrate-binding protein
MQRICSLLPSATEIACGLGLADRLVAITHECDYPPEVQGLPRITESVIDSAGMTSREVDQAVRRSLENLSTIYYIDRDRLRELQPELILTQELCEVCAVAFGQVQSAAQSICPGASILSLEPNTIEGIFDTIRQVGAATGTERAAHELIHGLKARCRQVSEAAPATNRPRVLALEWLDPLFTGGHWVPEMIEIAGGISLLTEPGERSKQIAWADVIAAQPDVIILMPCGYDLGRTIADCGRMQFPEELFVLSAVLNDRVFAVDGSAYFNRPGPRVVDGVELLAASLHPDIFGAPHPTRVRRVKLAIAP